SPLVLAPLCTTLSPYTTLFRSCFFYTSVLEQCAAMQILSICSMLTTNDEIKRFFLNQLLVSGQQMRLNTNLHSFFYLDESCIFRLHFFNFLMIRRSIQ